MKDLLVPSSLDPMGHAICDFLRDGRCDRLRLFSSDFEEDEFPVSDLFRTFEQMPLLERVALERARGRILDVGAGSGCHSLALQGMGKDVMAIDISALSIEAVRAQGVLKAELVNFYDPSLLGGYDTILMLMNGTGFIGKIEGIGRFFDRLSDLLALGGEVLIDSSDLRYLYEDEDGSFEVDLMGEYYGEIDFQMQYRDVVGERFDWLYLDFDSLSFYAEQFGFRAELIESGCHYDYLASLTLA
ncbi:MAG: methyltransferase domain-containing protein [Rikenellaceae bacterium]